ncbi:hypothetical protein K9B35_14350 [Sphingomonas sp. R647]|uniref:hypothetical protein n=1 Tax=Sphingomonas sp. R647 TaxID=2875233 RepID=UPI001CD4552A|nr:hypothetical protein [Sphingomonas sp. R647]MCA1199155.1 hypothetical protein [Sphingomonas sp. R647]
MVDTRNQPIWAELSELRAKVREYEDAGLKGGGGGGTSGGMTDDWKASVETQLARLHGDIRAMLRIGVASVVALAAMVGGLYFYIDQKDDARMATLHAMQVEQTKISAKLDAVLELREQSKAERAPRQAER